MTGVRERKKNYGAGGAARFSNLRAQELMQWRCPVGVGPSSNTCPRCHRRAQSTSTAACHGPCRHKPDVLLTSPRARQPVRESNFALSYREWPHS
jgi:hypothetical protein